MRARRVRAVQVAAGALLAGAVLAVAGHATDKAGDQQCRPAGSGDLMRPDRGCTPGAWNPAVRQDTIRVTICKPRWATAQRPSLPARMLREIAAAYGETAPSAAKGEFDHLVPISLGGALADRANVWFEPSPVPNLKDRVEGAARRAVCTGKLGLDDARRRMAADWVELGRSLKVRGVS